MIRIKNFVGMFLVFVMLFAFSACGKTPVENVKANPADEMNAKKQVTITVSAGAGFKDALNELKNVYEKENPNVNITYNFAASGSLQQQIENGADVDLFISAAQKQVNDLKEKGLLEDGTRIDLLGNKIVVIVPKDSSLAVTFEELDQDKVKKLALGEPKSVPVGQYAEEMFKKLNILDKIKTKAIYAKDVREVLTWVETGNVDAGVVYETDAMSSEKVKKVAEAPDGSHKPIVCPAAIIKSSKNLEKTKAFLTFLSGENGKIVFEKYGFEFLPKQ